MSNENAYNELFDILSYTAEQKAHIAVQAAAEAEAVRRKTRRGFKSLSKVAAVAVCLVSVLTITAEAAGIPTPLSGILAPIFGGSVAQTEVIDKIGRPINASDTDNGITISADAIIGDTYNACIVFTISRDDGTALLAPDMEATELLSKLFLDISFSNRGSSHGYIWCEDPVPGDAEIQLIYGLSSDEPVSKGICTVEVTSKLQVNENETVAVGESLSARDAKSCGIEGEWKFRFNVDYEDTAVTLGNGETFRQDDMTFTIQEIRISPIAYSVSYDVDEEVHWSHESSGRLPEDDKRQWELFSENVQITLTKKDGTTVDLSTHSGGSVGARDGFTHCIKSAVFGEVIPLEELENITVGGVVFPIHA